MTEQMYGYLGVCVVCGVLLFFLMRANDRHELEKIKKVQQEEEAK